MRAFCGMILSTQDSRLDHLPIDRLLRGLSGSNWRYHLLHKAQGYVTVELLDLPLDADTDRQLAAFVAGPLFCADAPTPATDLVTFSCWQGVVQVRPSGMPN